MGEETILDKDTVVVDATNSELDNSEAELTTEQMQAEITKLKNINVEVIKSRDEAKVKLRTHDDTLAKQANDELVEKEKFKELYETLNEKHETLVGTIKLQKIDIALTAALQEAGVTSIPTAIKLMDKSGITVGEDGSVEGVAAMIDKLKTDHEIVFAPIASAPSPVTPSEDDPAGGYHAELKALLATGKPTQKDFDALRSKYGK